MQPSPLPNSRTFLSPHKETPCPSAVISYRPFISRITSPLKRCAEVLTGEVIPCGSRTTADVLKLRSPCPTRRRDLDTDTDSHVAEAEITCCVYKPSKPRDDQDHWPQRKRGGEAARTLPGASESPEPMADKRWPGI